MVMDKKNPFGHYKAADDHLETSPPRYRHFIHSALKMEAVWPSERLVSAYKSTQRYNQGQCQHFVRSSALLRLLYLFSKYFFQTHEVSKHTWEELAQSQYLWCDVFKVIKLSTWLAQAALCSMWKQITRNFKLTITVQKNQEVNAPGEGQTQAETCHVLYE